jgi:hypothetical protein
MYMQQPEVVRVKTVCEHDIEHTRLKFSSALCLLKLKLGIGGKLFVFFKSSP